MRIVIGGDVSIHDAEEAFARKKTNELFNEGLRNLFRSVDEVVVNLECAITDKDTPIKKFGPNLRAPLGTGEVLKEAGVTLCALSNNHIFDFGKAGTKDTFAELRRCGLRYTGYGENETDARRDYVFERDGVKIAVVNVCEHEYTYALPNREGARAYDPYDTTDDIVAAKKNADYVVVIYHGGKEECRYPSPRLIKLCRSMVRHGADVVLCQHSHCIGCYEEFEGGHILYGQGNFHFAWAVEDEAEARQWDTGLAVVIETEGAGMRVTFEPVVMKGICLCLADEEEKALLLGELTERSKSLQDGSWYEYWKEFCEKAESYTDTLMGDDLEKKAHYLDCESHVDVLKERHKTWNHTNEMGEV